MRSYKKEDFSKGQTVFIYVVGNAARYCKPGIENRIQEWEVKTVGSKYITAVNKKCSFREAKFSIENDFRQACERGPADYILFLTKEEIYRMHQRSVLRISIIDALKYGSILGEMEMEDLQAIARIIEKYKKKD